jgi:hypothetical protein
MQTPHAPPQTRLSVGLTTIKPLRGMGRGETGRVRRWRSRGIVKRLEKGRGLEKERGVEG